jgi:dienelactone hydrolase
VLQSQTGCAFGYDLYHPPGMSGAAQVVLAHGFLRNRERMQDLARALAEAGYATAAIDLCNMRPWDGAHEVNAADMRLTAQTLGRPGVVYAGFSAGGLAALLAARTDSDSLGVVVLDLVDQRDLGRQAAADLRVPVVGLFGAPSRCNANGNGLPVLAGAVDVEVERFANATHCDFESPTDNLCRLFCEPGDRDPDDAARQRARVIASTVAAVDQVWQSASASAADASHD